MSHIVSSSAPISGAHTVKQYAGFGILGSAIPTTGDSGGSPVANDGVNANGEYHWRVETPPSAGALTIYPDLSFGFDATGLSNTTYTWVYRLYEDGVSVGTATVSLVVGVVAQIAAAGAAQSSGSANISGGAPGAISAAGSANASGTAALTIGGVLAAAGGDQAGGSAQIKASVGLSAEGYVQSIGAGQLVVDVQIAAVGQATASGSAVFTLGQIAIRAPSGNGPRLRLPDSRRPASTNTTRPTAAGRRPTH